MNDDSAPRQQHERDVEFAQGCDELVQGCDANSWSWCSGNVTFGRTSTEALAEARLRHNSKRLREAGVLATTTYLGFSSFLLPSAPYLFTQRAYTVVIPPT